MSLLIQVAATLPTEGPGKWRCVQSVLGGCHSWWDLDVAKVGVSLLLSAMLQHELKRVERHARNAAAKPPT